ncbi:LamG-like jellyroll fold domain-containing protein [Occallatibacter savannae]|uniref:LamG-like jellyroll fold domain-containing protein n=1 Tax=Occallatibacter savannae TaxID=1002691 RepID=UPI000D6987DB|nr:LamG-like jellyroll fold domain-containing protein [Occallatibacter savannae]
MISLPRGFFVLATTTLLFCSASIALAQDSAVTLGKRESVQSKILGEKREILVSVPKQTKPNMPLLIVLDGEWTFSNVAVVVNHLTGNGRLPPMVVAGVVNTNRGRDLMPTFEGAEFANGPSDKFLSFLADELIPQLTSEYSLGNYHILLGHSNAGMFSLYAFIRRPEVFQANLAISPSYGLDDRFVALLSEAIAKPAARSRFVFIGAGGDEEADISVGALRFAKTFESSPNADVEYHYEVFPGETHGTVGLRAFYRGLELLAEPDPHVSHGPARYLTEAQRRRHAWVRRFGSAYADDKLPQYSAARPMLDELSAGNTDLTAFWNGLKAEYGDDFRFDPSEGENLIASLSAAGRQQDVARLKEIPGFTAEAGVTNNYGSAVDLKSGLVALLPLNGSAVDVCHPESKSIIHGATLTADRHGRANMAYAFNGSGAYIEFPKNADYDNAGSITVTAWVKPHKPAAYTAWVSQVGPRWGSQWRLGFGPNPAAQWGATTFGTRWTDYWVNGDGFPIGIWVHTAAVFDQTLGKLRLYINGREVQTREDLGPWGSSKGPILIGAQRDDGLFFSGDVGSVRVYRRALNSSEVEAINKLEKEPESCK